MEGFTNNTLPNSFELKDNSIIPKVLPRLNWIRLDWIGLLHCVVYVQSCPTLHHFQYVLLAHFVLLKVMVNILDGYGVVVSTVHPL